MTPTEALAIMAYDIADQISRSDGYDGLIPEDMLTQDQLIELLPALFRAAGFDPFARAEKQDSPAERAAGEWEYLPHTCNPNKPGHPLPFGRKAPKGVCGSCDQLRAGRPPREAPPAIRASNRRREQEEQTLRDMRSHNCVTAGCHKDGYGNRICTAFDW